MIQTAISYQQQLFAEPETTTTSGIDCLTTGRNSLVGSIGETYFDLWCLSRDISVFMPIAQNSRIDRIIWFNERFLRIHIKTANISDCGHVFTLWSTNAWRVRSNMDKCKIQSSEADYFVCLGIYQNKIPEKMWWLPYDIYKDKQSVCLDSGMSDLLAGPVQP
jgi:hypothetical protein